ncbi:MAG: PIG-L family deacetylase [Chloroflexi bacterium]|nr:PIG-L family deacetylase [Chloroflexota bacterium]
MEWDEIRSAMVVFAHPDDAEFGSAGTSSRMVREGKDVFYVVVTDGSKGSSDPEMTPERLIATRKREQCEAARIVGVTDVSFLGFPDGMLEPTLEVRRAITACIRRYKPDLVICQSPSRDFSMGPFVQHPDHLAAGEAALAAIYPCARDRMTFPELLAEGLEPHAVREVWVAGTGSPDYFVDISQTIETKVQALLAHASQVSERVREFVPERARKLGEGQGMEYAEAFRRIQLPG